MTGTAKQDCATGLREDGMIATTGREMRESPLNSSSAADSQKLLLN